MIVQLPALLVSGSVGIWLFYVQHQFEDTYWQSGETWSYDDAALKGSSYLRLPRPLQFLTGNIGLHHVHHLSARIPNYNLQAAHDENAAAPQRPDDLTRRRVAGDAAEALGRAAGEARRLPCRARYPLAIPQPGRRRRTLAGKWESSVTTLNCARAVVGREPSDMWR